MSSERSRSKTVRVERVYLDALADYVRKTVPGCDDPMLVWEMRGYVSALLSQVGVMEKEEVARLG